MSPKHCSVCNNQAFCKDTRQGDLHVRRRYICDKCDNRWTTYEMRKEKWQELRQQLIEFREELKDEKRFHERMRKLLGALGEVAG